VADFIAVFPRNERGTNMLSQLSETLSSQRWNASMWETGLHFFYREQDKILLKVYDYPANGLTFIVSGNIFIHPLALTQLKSQQVSGISKMPEAWLPEAWLEYGKNITSRCTGDFNLFVYDKQKRELSVISSQLGMILLYYYIHHDYILFSSKIHYLLLTGLVPAAIDKVSWMERYIFHHSLGENTGILDVLTFPPASIMIVHWHGAFRLDEYWNVDEFLTFEKRYNYKQGLEIIDESIHHVIGKYFQRITHPAVTLTGGWDGRLVLSYLLNKHPDFFLYSFGAENSEDIRIPAMIADQMGLEYKPILLNADYLDNYFNEFAVKTIINSDGMRPITRAHYLFAMDIIGQKSNSILSGNCGSNILKNAKSPDYMMNEELLSFLEAGSIHNQLRAKILEILKSFPNFHIEKPEIDAFFDKLDSHPLCKRTDLLPNQRFYHFLLHDIERKYFGTEMNTYSSQMQNFSFFIDYDFLKIFTQTAYFGSHLPFYHKSLLSRYHATSLYANLINRNSPKLASFVSDKGFSLAEALTLTGQVSSLAKRMYIRYKRKHKIVDTFNTCATFEMFEKFLLEKGFSQHELLRSSTEYTNSQKGDYYSYLFWTNKFLT